MILFDVKEARNQLTKHKKVYTIRNRMYPRVDTAFYHSPTGQLVTIGKVHTTFVCFVTCPEDLLFYKEQSGFSSAVDWYFLAQKIHENRGPFMLFKVELI